MLALSAFVRALPPPPTQISQITDAGMEVLRADLANVIALALIIGLVIITIVVFVVLRMTNVIAKQSDASARQNDLMDRKIDNDKELIKSFGITNRAVEHLTNALDEQTLLLARIDDGMKANVALNLERNAKSDGMSVDIKTTLTEVQSLAKDTKTGRAKAVDEITKAMSEEFKARDAKLDRIIELLERVDKKLDATQLENSQELREIKDAVAEVRALLPASTDDKPAEPTPP